MRFIKSILHPNMGISMYTVNGKYLIKFEKADCELSVKIPEEDSPNLAALEKCILEDKFLDKIKAQLEKLDHLRTSLFE